MPTVKTQDSPTDNRILSALPDAEMERVRGAFEFVEVKDGQVLWEVQGTSKYLYFPTSCLISLTYENELGASLSVATLGRNGVVGTGMILANVRSPDRGVVQYAGAAYRMEIERVKNELADCGDFHALLMAYTYSLLVMIAQNAICNRLHRIDQQVARWLLDCQDLLGTDDIRMTHDQIAGILGVRRESISLAASQLEKGHSIRPGRGRIKILDADKLERNACECHTVVKDNLRRALAEYRSEHPS